MLLKRLHSRARRLVLPSPNDIWFEGDYRAWGAALAAAGADAGYEGKAAVDRYMRRYREVMEDPAGAVRRAGLQLIPFMAAFSLAQPIDGVIEVLDFGGGYGAIYDLLSHLYPDKAVRWTVVELPGIVAKGAEMGASEWKRFASEIPAKPYSLVIASGTLQCLPDPKAGWEALARLRAPLFMVGRFPVVPSLTRDRLTVQHVPKRLFTASFPTWFFCRDWLDLFKAEGRLILQWDSPGDVTDLDLERFCFQAFLLAR